MSLRAAFLLVTTVLASPAWADQQVTILPVDTTVQLPVLVDGSYRGDIDVERNADGQLSVKVSQLRPLIAPILSQDAQTALAAAPANGRGFVEARALPPAIRVVIDEARLELDVQVDGAARKDTSVSMAEADPDANLDYLPAANVAAALSVDAGGSYSWRGNTRGFSAEAARLLGWVNIGGADGVFAEAESFYDNSDGSAFRRGDIRLFKDDVGRAIRYTIGDLFYDSTGFQFGPRVGGVSVERRYNDLTPLRTIRPLGRTQFSLDRAATVDVIVNGALFRTVRFNPGVYSINDIPFAEGGNNVELVIRDDTGRVERLQFDGFSSGTLLDTGLNEFSATLGVLSQPTIRGVAYDTGSYAASGYFRQGITNALTLGINAQAGKRQRQVGVEGVFGQGSFLIAGRAALSHADGFSSGAAGEINLQWRPATEGALASVTVDANARYTSRAFTGLGIDAPNNPFRLEASTRVGFPVGRDMRFSLGLGTQLGREGAPNVYRYSGTASRRFGVISAFATFDRRVVTNSVTENRFLLSLSYSLPARSVYARASYDSDRDAYRMELQRLPRGVVDDLSGTLALERNRNSVDLVGSAQYRHNRFLANADNGVVYNSIDRQVSAVVTRYGVRTGIALADGKFALGPNVGDGAFVIASPGRALKSGAVEVNRTREGVQARSGVYGPAVVGGLRPYVPNRIILEANTQDPDFEGATRAVNVLPGAHVGYVVGLADAVQPVVFGTLLMPDGKPAALFAGKIVATATGKEVGTTFTNRQGRFVIENVDGGSYSIVIDGTGSVPITIPGDQAGLVDVKTLTLRPAPGGDTP